MTNNAEKNKTIELNQKNKVTQEQLEDSIHYINKLYSFNISFIAITALITIVNIVLLVIFATTTSTLLLNIFLSLASISFFINIIWSVKMTTLKDCKIKSEAFTLGLVMLIPIPVLYNLIFMIIMGRKISQTHNELYEQLEAEVDEELEEESEEK